MKVSTRTPLSLPSGSSPTAAGAATTTLLILAFIVPSTALSAIIVDAPLTDTSQIRTAANNPYFASQTEVAAVALSFGPKTLGTLNGTTVDNYIITNSSLRIPGTAPLGPLDTMTLSTGHDLGVELGSGTGVESRSTTATLTGPDAAVANDLINHVWYMGSHHTFSDFTISGLDPDTNLYVQLIGDSAWAGDPAVTANGDLVGNWTDNKNGGWGSGSIFGFTTTSSPTGELLLDLRVPSSFGGISGFFVSAEAAAAPIPEPSRLLLLGVGLIAVAARRIRRLR